jgi:hypothetical protein
MNKAKVTTAAKTAESKVDNLNELTLLVGFQEELAKLTPRELAAFNKACEMRIGLRGAALNLGITVTELRQLSRQGIIPICKDEVGNPYISNAWFVMQTWLRGEGSIPYIVEENGWTWEFGDWHSAKQRGDTVEAEYWRQQLAKRRRRNARAAAKEEAAEAAAA